MAVEQIGTQEQGTRGRFPVAPEQAPVLRRTAGSSGAFLCPDQFGIVTAARERRLAFAKYIKPCLPPIKSHRITVNCKTGEKTVETFRILQPLPKPAAPKAPRVYVVRDERVKAVIAAVCTAWEVDPSFITSLSRHHKAVLPRFACFRILRSYKWSLNTIAKPFHRDHTTVMSGLVRAKELWRHNVAWREKYDTAVAFLNKTEE